MGSYTFKWEHPADEVFVTGTFDDWGKTVKLDKDASGVFQKTVQLPHTEEDILYKFVKDGEWVTSPTAPTHTDSTNNTNNVLKPNEYLNSAAPGSSTAAMAAAIPKTGSSATPGAFPETPGAAATTSSSATAGEPKDFSVNPIPASDGPGNPVDLKPGEKVPDPSTINSNTITSGVHDDPELKAQDEAKQKKEGEQTFGVAPIPASAGLGNPVDLKPGEKVPASGDVSANTVNSTVKLDKDSYEKSDAYPGAGTAAAAVGGAAVAGGAAAAGAGAFGLPPVKSNLIPESSLPAGEGMSAKDADPGVTMQSAAPESSTAALAGQVPKEPRSDLNDSTNSAAINSAAPASSTAALAGQVPKESSKTTSSAAGATTAASSAVPDEVKESQKEAGFAPEASANPEAVQEKAAMEKQLLKEVKTEQSSGEPAPTDAVATSATAPSTDAPTETPGKPAAEGTGAGAAATTAGAGAVAGAGAGAAGAAALKPDSPEPSNSRDVSPMTKAPTKEPSTTGAAAGTAGSTKADPETPKKGGAKDVGRRMSGAFKKWAGEGGVSGSKDTPGSTKTADTTTTTTTTAGASSSAAGTPSKEARGHKKKQSIFKKIKEAFK